MHILDKYGYIFIMLNRPLVKSLARDKNYSLGYRHPGISEELVVWYRADDPWAVAESSGGSLSGWRSPTPNAPRAEQSTGSNQPTLESAGVNGMPSVLFGENSSHWLTVADVDALDFTSEFTVIGVSEPDATDGGERTFLFKSGAYKVSKQGAGSGNELSMRLTTLGVKDYDFTENVFVENEALVWGVRFGDTADADIFKNGTELETIEGTTNASTTSNVMYLGNNETDTGKLAQSIGELMIFGRRLSDSEMTAIQSYLSAKWGLPNGVPGSLAPKLWLDASVEGSIVTGSTFIWEDQSGNRNDVTQSTGSAQPTTGATTQNGKNVLDFDGGDYLVIPTALESALLSTDMTIFVVCSSSSDSTTQRILNFDNGGSSRINLQYDSTTQQISFQSRNAGGGGTSTSGITKSDFNIIRARREGTTQAITFNGAAESTNASGADVTAIDSGSVGAFNEGAADFLLGSIAEIMVFDFSLSTSQISAVETYLSNKWDISI